MELIVPRDRSLTDLFSMAIPPDLEVLADLITDKGNGRVALDGQVKTTILKHREQKTLCEIASVLEAEIRAFGGNSLINLFRSSGVTYREIAVDVAKKLDGKPKPDDDVLAIEEIIIEQSIRQFVPEGGESPFYSRAAVSELLKQIVAGLAGASSTVAGIAATGGTAAIVGAVGGRAAALALPPAAIAIAGLTLFQAVGPAFRITVPAVLQVAIIRRARFDADLETYCEGLRECL
ncbi:hypothetical protein FXN63_11200 [Pigmentiphaga aceris]|uniref:DUF3944 domain-containing protein n=1 Tax=Pigmentiphaga aceris TaxID=1940612 RepID=A0A5C0AVU4_9BURK|nr:hypothetical protein [Pigmentiphaga aceris]QEI06335.1 hypothetical protein FXN63_11200 [Pigmentiphaga aceris]